MRPSGTGKTFLLEALDQHAVEQRLKIAWFTLEDLGVLLRRHRADYTVTKAIDRVLQASSRVGMQGPGMSEVVTAAARSGHVWVGVRLW